MKKLPVMLLFLIQAAALVLMTCGREGPMPPADKTPPTIKSTIPADGTGNNGTLGFALDGSIVITFTKEMTPSTINGQTIQVVSVSTGTSPIVGSVGYANGSATFTPAQQLTPGTTYTVTIDGSVQDTYGISMGTPFVFFFSTQPLPDTTPPSILYSSPSATSTGVAVNSSINVEFTEPVTASTLTFQLINQSTMSAVTCTMNYNGATTATFTPLFTPPAISLDGNTVYKAAVKAGLKDLVGNKMVSDYTWTFSTGAGFDTTPPVVTATTPTAGASGVSATTYLQVTFNEPVNEATANITLFSTATGTPVLVPYVLDGYDNTTNMLSYKPSNSLTLGYNMLYTARVSGIVDLSGNVMPDMTWSFTTGKADTSLSIYASDNNTQYGSPITFTTTVSSDPSSSAGVPTGTVTFTDNGAALPNGTVPLAGNTATFTISTLTLGTHIITATYSGDAIFATSTASVTQTVGQGSTTTIISAPSVTYGLNGIVTVTISSVSGVPIGSVSLSVDSGPTTTQALSNGSTVFTIVKPAVGSHTLTATYVGQGNFLGSTADGSLAVGQGATTTLISAPTVNYGANGIVMVTVSSPSGTPTGNVSLSWDTGTATQTLNGSGSATFTITSPFAGVHPLTATYTAQGSFLDSTASGNLTVNQAPTHMTVSAPAIAFGQPGIVTVTVTSGVLLPVGNVALIVDGNAATPMIGGLISSGVATFSITTPSVGTHTLSATYPYQPDPSNNNFGPSSAGGSLGVGSGATTMTMTFTTPITYGTNGIVQVGLTSASSGVPTGSVSLSDTVSNVTTTWTQQLVTGATTFTISNPIVGLHTLVATYTPLDNNFLGNTQSNNLTVSQAATTTGIASSANPSQFNNSVTFTATVTPATATGTITFKDGLTSIGTVTLVSGVAIYSTPTLSVATHSITAAYSGAAYFAASTSATLPQIVNKATTGTTLTSSTGGQPVTPGTLVTFTATLNPAAAPGTVTFWDGVTSIGTGTVGTGTATFGTTALSAGTHNITAVYNGGTNYTASTSNAVVQSVTNGSVTIGVLSSLPTSTYGNSVTFTATVTGNGAVPTGTVTFKDGATTLGTNSLNGGSPDTATFSTAALVAGAHSITAVYNGDANYSGNQASAAIPQAVVATTTTSFVTTSGTSTYGNTVTFTAAVTGQAGSGTPAGTVSFNDGASLLCNGTLNGGSPNLASCTTTTTAMNAGSHSITVVYNGNTYFTTSTSSALPWTVNPAPTNMGISAPSVASGANGIVTITVSSGILLTVGNVYLSVDGGGQTMMTLTSGAAQYNLGSLPVGGHSLSASYPTQGNFLTSSATGTLSVGQASSSTSIALTGGTNPSTYGDSVTFTATVTAGATGSVTFKDGSTTIGSGSLGGGVASFSTTTLTVATHNITATYNGDANYGTSTSSNLQQIVTKASSATSLGSSLNPSTYGQSVTFTATVTPSTATGSVTFKDGSTTIGSGQLSGGVASFSTSTLTAVSHAITAAYGGDTNYLTSTSDPVLQNVNKADQTITFNPPATKIYGDLPFVLSATGGASGNSVTFAVTSGPGSITGSTLTITGAGSIVVTASQGGNANYNAAADVQKTIAVSKADQTITFTPLGTVSILSSSLTLTATASSGLPVTYTSPDTTVVSITGSIVTFVSQGTANITAQQAGDTNYNAAVNVVQPLTIGP